jgi:hypothetical protein
MNNSRFIDHSDVLLHCKPLSPLIKCAHRFLLHFLLGLLFGFGLFGEFVGCLIRDWLLAVRAQEGGTWVGVDVPEALLANQMLVDADHHWVALSDPVLAQRGALEKAEVPIADGAVLGLFSFLFFHCR